MSIPISDLNFVTQLSGSRLTSDSVIFEYHAKSESSERLLAKGLLPFIRPAICLRENYNAG